MSMLRPLYDWAIKQAQKPYATAILFLMALVEPCFSPLPPDVLLIPMVIGHRDKAFRFAWAAVVGLLLGSLIGYGIGALGMNTLGQWIIRTYNLQEGYTTFYQTFDKWGVLLIIGKGLVPFVPIPLSFLVLASGGAHMNILLFAASVVLSQGLRVFAEAWLLHRYGAPVRTFIERYLTWIGVAMAVAVGLIGWAILRH